MIESLPLAFFDGFSLQIPWTITLACACVFSYLVGRITWDETEPEGEPRDATARQSAGAAFELKRVVDSLHRDLDDHGRQLRQFKKQIARLECDAGEAPHIDAGAKETLRSTMRLVNQVMRAYDDIRRQTSFLKRASDSGEPVKATADPNSLEESLTRMFAMQARYELPFSIVSMALAADQATADSDQTTQQLVADTIRDTDVFHRDSGGNWLILLPNTKLPPAVLFAQRLADRATQQGLTVHVGVAAASESDDPLALLGRCDEARHASVRSSDVVCYHEGHAIRPAPAAEAFAESLPCAVGVTSDA